ncbi:phosphate/phosphite/phosphonate ABC transporter substrate-binding protein [Marinobacter oulmenensis]|nr:phosphate/phosphite/phosphonate ABC transporter substrate-binding protein [Marinobacter oulmenensis]
MLRALLILILVVPAPLLWADNRWDECLPGKLVFTMIPKKDMDEQLVEYRPLVALLGEGLGIPVEMVRPSSYDSVVDGLVSRAVDVAVLGPAAYIMARERDDGIQAFASLAVRPGHYTPAGSFYRSLLLVRAEREFRRAADLRGARVALTDPASTSGSLIPKTAFADAINRPLEVFFGGRVYAGSHDNAMDALLADRVDAAFVSSSRVDEYLRRGLIDKDTFRVLWNSEPLHYDPFVFRSGLCPALRQRISQLMTQPSERRQAFLESVHATDITPVEHADYRPVENLMK